MARKKRLDILFNGSNLKENLKSTSDDIYNTTALINTQLNQLNLHYKKTQSIEIAEQVTRLLETRADLVKRRLLLIEFQKYVLQHKGDFLIDLSEEQIPKPVEPIVRLIPQTPKRYYVYIHKNKTTGEPFYVGKGSGNRAYTGTRSIDWKAYVSNIKFDYDVEIHKDDLDEKTALQLEFDLMIELSKKHKLLNKLPNKITRRFALVNNNIIMPSDSAYPVNNGQQKNVD